MVQGNEKAFLPALNTHALLDARPTLPFLIKLAGSSFALLSTSSAKAGLLELPPLPSSSRSPSPASAHPVRDPHGPSLHHDSYLLQRQSRNRQFRTGHRQKPLPSDGCASPSFRELCVSGLISLVISAFAVRWQDQQISIPPSPSNLAPDLTMSAGPPPPSREKPSNARLVVPHHVTSWFSSQALAEGSSSHFVSRSRPSY